MMNRKDEYRKFIFIFQGHFKKSTEVGLFTKPMRNFNTNITPTNAKLNWGLLRPNYRVLNGIVKI